MAELASPDERRRFKRYSVRCDCWLEHDDWTIYGTTADLGLGGLFLRSAVPVEGGHTVDVMLNVAGASQPIRATAQVTRAVKPTHGTRHGIGVEFVHILQGREALASFLAGAPVSAHA